MGDLSNLDFGPGEVLLISSLVIPFSTALNTITLDSTGDMGHQEQYTINGLQGGAEPSLDLSARNFGPADVGFLATLMTSFKKFAAALSEVNLKANPAIQVAGVETLRDSQPSVS